MLADVCSWLSTREESKVDAGGERTGQRVIEPPSIAKALRCVRYKEVRERGGVEEDGDGDGAGRTAEVGEEEA